MATEATRNCKILICKILGLSDFQQGSDSVPDKLHDLGSHGALCFNAQCAPTISVTRSNADRSYVRTHPKQITLVSAPPYQLSFASGGSERWGCARSARATETLDVRLGLGEKQRAPSPPREGEGAFTLSLPERLPLGSKMKTQRSGPRRKNPIKPKTQVRLFDMVFVCNR